MDLKGPEVLDSRWYVEEVSALRGYAIEWISPEKAIVSRGSELLHGDSLDGPFSTIGTIPLPRWQHALSRNRFARRLLRLMYFNVLPSKNNRYFATFDKTIGIFDNSQFIPISINNHFRVLRQGTAQLSHSLFLGEYFHNPQRQSVRVFRIDLDSTNPRLQTAYIFPQRHIRHIHRIQLDPYTNDLWCMTGDLPKECFILKTSDQFDTIDVVGGGDETWRCISPVFLKDYIYYATDSEYHQNSIYRIDRQTGSRELICHIDGPVYYSTHLEEHIFFAVTAELCPSQHFGHASLWHLSTNDQSSPKNILRVPKDSLSVKWFLPGTLYFPTTIGEQTNLYWGGFGLSGSDYRVFCLKQKS